MIEKINYFEYSKTLLLGEMRKPNILKRLEIFCFFLQELENVFFDILNTHNIKQATNKSLDYFGESVGQPRPLTGPASINDNTYRALIFAKIFENISNGSKVEINNILRLLGANEIYHRDVKPAAININLKGDLFISNSEIKEALESATLPIEIDLIQYYSEPLGFSGDNSAFGFSVGCMGS